MLLKGTGPILSSGPFHIVPMQAHHLDALAQLERCCFSTPWTRDGLAAELTSETACFVAAEPAGQPGVAAGYAGMHYIAGEGYIDNVAVFPEYRRLHRELSQASRQPLPRRVFFPDSYNPAVLDLQWRRLTEGSALCRFLFLYRESHDDRL